MSRRTQKAAGPSDATLLRYFRKSGRLVLGEADGDMWVSDAYMAVRLSGDKNPIARLLALYNLPFEPMSCRVVDTIVRQSSDAPPMAKLIPATKGLIPARRFCVGSAPVLLESSGFAAVDMLELWQAGDHRLCVNPRIRQMVDLFAPGEWFANPTSTQTKPLAKVDERKVTAIAMPVRNLATMSEEAA